MPTHSWGGAYNNTAMNTAINGDYFYSDSISMVTTRLAADGQRPIRFPGPPVHGYLTNGESDLVYQGVAVNTARFFANSGGTFVFRGLRVSGTCSVGRNTGESGSTYWFSGGSLAGMMPGSIVYQEAPSAPRTPAVVSDAPDEAEITWIAPSDNGGTAITGYRVQRATNAGFTTGVTNFDVGVVLTYTDTTVDAGTEYFYRVFAKNAVTTAGSTTSVASSTVSVTPAGVRGKRWDGSAEVDVTVGKRWNGSAEVDITTAVRWNGSAEVPLA